MKTQISRSVLTMMAVIVLAFTSCKKDKNFDPLPNEKVLVSFSPTLYGEVVPWLKTDKKTSKGFNDFENKFFQHVIRIYKSDNTFVIDIPITLEGAGNYSYTLNTGSYKAEVLPVTEDVLAGNGTYTPLFLAQRSLNKAPIYTRTAVAFTVTPSNVTPVSLPCVTDYALLQLDFGGTYQSIGTPRPEVYFMNGLWFNNHNDGNETATYDQLLNASYKFWLSPDGSGETGYGEVAPSVLTPGTSEAAAFWYIDTNVKLYYMYRIPGSPNALSLPVGDGTNTSYTANSATYLAFGVFGNTGLAYPVIWCKDYFGSRTWVANTTLRISFNNAGSGNFTVTQNDWFSTIITGK